MRNQEYERSVERADKALSASGYVGDNESNIRDLMADLAHLAEKYGTNGMESLKRAMAYFEEENG